MIPLPARWRRHAVFAAIERLAPTSALRALLSIPEYEGAVLTPRRILNLYLNRWEALRLRETLRSYPAKLTVEPTNICNLRCPACFTGVGQSGRKSGPLRLDLFLNLLRELGDYLFQIEFTNWGEPLLAKDLCAMIRAASERGISTTTSTNLSLPFDRDRAEALVASGLDVLGVSIDGARQQTYEQYRVRGNLDTVLSNCRMLVDAKRRMGSSKPKLVWEFHVFPHNVDDIETGKAMAAALGMEISISKGWVIGPEWKAVGDHKFFLGNPEPFPCLFLWHFAVVNNDGGVAPCCGTFYREDDMGKLSTGVGDAGSESFRAVWNGARFREARRLYKRRADAPEEARARICHDCPSTILWEQWQDHLAAGLSPDAFRSTFNFNDGFNYFWQRRPERAPAPRSGAAPAAPASGNPGEMLSTSGSSGMG